MDFAELTQSRRTVQQFAATGIEDHLVEEALRLSLWAPNHRTTWPWAYYWTGPETRRHLADLSVELKSVRETLSEVKKAALRDSVLNPSHLIFLGLRKSEPKLEHEDFATLSCSVQIATTWLWEKGIGTKWSTGAFTMHPRTYEILGVDPGKVQLEGALMIGLAAQTPKTPERPPLSQHLLRTP